MTHLVVRRIVKIYVLTIARALDMKNILWDQHIANHVRIAYLKAQNNRMSGLRVFIKNIPWSGQIDPPCRDRMYF